METLVVTCAVVGAIEAGGQRPVANASLMVSVARYVEDYEQQLGAIIGDEDDTQVVSNAQRMPRRRQLHSEFALVRLPTDDQRWIGIRDVLQVDGRPVASRAEQILALLKLPYSMRRANMCPMAERPKAAQGTFDELLAGIAPDLAAIARRLRTVIRSVDASTVETVRLGDNAATYGVGPKKMTDGYAYIMPMRGYINLGFYQGAVLADPERLLEGTGKGLRHVKIRSLAEASRPRVRALVAKAIARRRSGAYTGPVTMA